MSLFNDSLRPPPLASDEAVRRYIELIRAELEPDPLFRRRLRGSVVNRFVAAREGLAQPATSRGRSQMGRLGRACLYASFAVALSVGGAMAASRGSVPGDPLYLVKLQMEALRLQTFPEQFRDDLLVDALSERVSELGRLVEEGRWEQVSRLAAEIGDRYEELAALDLEVPAGDQLTTRMAVLDVLHDRLPDQAKNAIERAMAAPSIAPLRESRPTVNPRHEPPSIQGPPSGSNNAGASPTRGPAEVEDANPVVDSSAVDRRADADPTPAATPKPSHGPAEDEDDQGESD